MAGMFDTIGHALGQVTPQQRAMLLRMAAANTQSPVGAQGLMQQADDYIKISENSKRQALVRQELDQRKEYDKFRMDVYKDELKAKREAEKSALAEQQAYGNEMRKVLSTPKEKWGELATTITHPKVLEFIGKPLTKGPLVEVNTGSDFKVPSGFMRNPEDPMSVVPIPGGPAEGRTPEQAAKEQMLQVAKDAFTNIQGMLFSPNGKVNRQNLMMSVGGGVPFTQGKTLANQFEVGIQAITRNETGAAMPPEEVDNTRKRFQPGPLDSDDLIRVKWQMYQDFINGSLSLVRKSKGGEGAEFDSEMFDAELSKRLSQSESIEDIINRNL